MPSRPNDGGAWSLAGYIYQLLGSAAERVRLDNAPAAAAGDASLRFFIEQHGQDAAVDDESRARLVQFKYSQGGRPIQPAELAEILLGLEKSSKLMRGKAKLRWQLVTNRPFSPTAERYFGVAGQASGSRKGHVSRSAEASPAQIIVRFRRRLDVLRRDLDEFQSSLQEAANTFGVDDDGVAGRVLDLLQAIAVNAPDRREVSLGALNQALAGYPNPKSIRLRDRQGDMRSALESTVRAHEGINLRDVLERRGLQPLLAQRAALAVVYGPGGCGKTLSLFRMLDQRLSDGIGPAGMIVERPRALGQLLGTWRNAPSSTGSSTEALRQLRVANPDVRRPVLVLGFDGLDEVPDSERAEAEELIRHFHRMHVELQSSQVEPDGLLVVTCRNKEDLDDVVAPRGTGGPAQPEIPSLKIDEFSEEEFAAVWALWFHDEPVPRSGRPDEMFATIADTAPGAAAPDQRLLALRHPVLLGCAKLLSTEQRTRLYQGDAGLWSQVLNSYFNWFTRKASRRARCSPKKAREVLKAVARATAGKSGACDRDDDWVAPAIEHTGDTRYLVSQIFDDAVTAGVVEISGRSRYTLPAGTPIEWRWRFPDLAAHLASLA
jgi:hypothetical protein